NSGPACPLSGTDLWFYQDDQGLPKRPCYVKDVLARLLEPKTWVLTPCYALDRQTSSYGIPLLKLTRSHTLLVQERIAREIQHGRFLAQHGAGEIWNWESPAGKLRWARRVKMIGNHLGPGMSVLEMGCGAGYFTGELARSGADVVAIDVS